MAKTANSVSALEAKTRLAELLRETERGRSFVIRRRGKAVARLVPVEPDRPVGFAALAAAFREIRQRVRGPVKIRALIERGRRH